MWQASFAGKMKKKKQVFAEEAFSAMESNDHSRRLAHYSLKIADLLDLSFQEKEQLRLLCYCYDIGKFVFDGFPYEEVTYFSPEARLAHRHTEIGAKIAQSLPQLCALSELIRFHHERWDGSGIYGLKGEQIPILCRVFSVSWVYDKMIRPGGGRVGMVINEALGQLERYAGCDLDPEVVALLIELLAEKQKMGFPFKLKAAISLR